MFRKSISLWAGFYFVKWVFESFRNHLLGNRMIYTAIALTIAIDKAFMAIVVMLYSTSSWTFKFHFTLSLYNLKFPIIEVFFFNFESLALKLCSEFLKIIGMKFQLGISSYKMNRFFLIVMINFACDKDVFEFSLWGNNNR